MMNMVEEESEDIEDLQGGCATLVVVSRRDVADPSCSAENRGSSA